MKRVSAIIDFVRATKRAKLETTESRREIAPAVDPHGGEIVPVIDRKDPVLLAPFWVLTKKANVCYEIMKVVSSMLEPRLLQSTYVVEHSAMCLVEWWESRIPASEKGGMLETVAWSRQNRVVGEHGEELSTVEAAISKENIGVMMWFLKWSLKIQESMAETALATGKMTALKWMYEAEFIFPSEMLMIAAIQGDVPTVSMVIKSNSYLVTAEKCKALEAAAGRGHLDAVKMLTAKRRSIPGPAVIAAARSSQHRVLKWFNRFAMAWKLPLLLAVENETPEVIVVLSRYSNICYGVDKAFESAVFYNRPRVLQAMVDSFGDSEDLFELMKQAAFWNRRESVKTLYMACLSSISWYNPRKSDMRLANTLDYCMAEFAMHGRIEMLEYLQSKGGVCKCSRAMVDIARAGRSNVISWLNGHSPLSAYTSEMVEAAARNGHELVLIALVVNKAVCDKLFRDRAGVERAVHAARANRHHNVAKLLIAFAQR